jgi:hypothetical protein
MYGKPGIAIVIDYLLFTIYYWQKQRFGLRYIYSMGKNLPILPAGTVMEKLQ